MNEPKIILVIEDDEDIRTIVKEYLEEVGYVVKSAANGLEALKQIQKEGLPNLILLDMRMPVMNGWQFAAEFIVRYDHLTPIVVMTAAGDAEQRARDIQADTWLEKPFAQEELQLTIEKYSK